MLMISRRVDTDLTYVVNGNRKMVATTTYVINAQSARVVDQTRTSSFTYYPTARFKPPSTPAGTPSHTPRTTTGT